MNIEKVQIVIVKMANHPKTLLKMMVDEVSKLIIEGKLKNVELDSHSMSMVSGKLYEYNFNKWKDNIYDSLVEIESKNWISFNVEYIKYYDDDGSRDWYLDVVYNTIDNPDDDIMIKQHEHPRWSSYYKYVTKYENDYEDEEYEEDYDY